MAEPLAAARFRVPMTGRDVAETHRGTTPLELLFDLCFVVGVSQAAGELHHALLAGSVGTTLVKYLAVFFAIWWAWMNFTWFASAYDTDDILYRLFTLIQMAGALTLAAGIPKAFTHEDFLVVTIGYTILRVGMVAQWLRSAVEDPSRRRTALAFALGLTAVQALWLLRLALPRDIGLAVFPMLVLAELAVPLIAENVGPRTPWHPGHIVDRYGAFTVIVLGEVILSASMSVEQAANARGLSGSLLAVAIGGLVLVFSMWWLYFKRSAESELRTRTISPFAWGYGQYVVFSAVAAVGACVGAMVDSVQENGVHDRLIGMVLASAVAVYLLVLAVMRLASVGGRSAFLRNAVGAVVVLVLGAVGLPAGVTVVSIGVACALTLVWHLVTEADGGA